MHDRVIVESFDKDASGRGTAIIVYWLYLFSIMTVVTAPIGLVLAHVGRRRSAAWVRTHLDYQIRTFWWAAAGLLVAALAWQLIGRLGWPASLAWNFGYVAIILAFAWLVARCAFGLGRLMQNEAISRPGG